MTNDASQAFPARFEFLPAGVSEPAIVRAAGDIDLTNVGQFQAALDQAAAASSAITADLTAAGSINETLLRVSGLDQVAAVVTLG
jgi:DNA-binding MurR/RpiR family transcriptional regulator